MNPCVNVGHVGPTYDLPDPVGRGHAPDTRGHAPDTPRCIG